MNDGGRRARGLRAESAVADYLIARGFTLLAQGLRLGKLEIDLVARLGALVAVVEVRTRGSASWQGALASVGPRKRAHLLEASERLWREKLAQDRGIERFRIDVAGVTFAGGETRIEYVEGAITG